MSTLKDTKDKAMNEEQFQTLWLKQLTNKQKKERMHRAFAVLNVIGEKQIEFLQQYEHSNNTKGIGFMYYLNTLKSVWNNIAFVIGLAKGMGKFKAFAFHPARTIVENTFRLEHFINQTDDEKNRIAVTEFLRIIKRGYLNEQKKGRDPADYLQHYNEFAAITGGFPAIDDFKENDANPFPTIKKMIEKTNLESGIEWYHHYQSLCEVTHGKFFRTMMASYNPLSEYVSSAMYTMFMAINVLKITDVFIYGKVTQEVASVIERAEEIIKKPLTD